MGVEGFFKKIKIVTTQHSHNHCHNHDTKDDFLVWYRFYILFLTQLFRYLFLKLVFVFQALENHFRSKMNAIENDKCF